MIKKIEHIGIAVKNIEESNALFTRLFGKAQYKVESVESETKKFMAEVMQLQPVQ